MRDSVLTRGLGTRSRSGHRTTLVVPVPTAEEAVGTWRAAHDIWATRGVPAHVTVQGPFLPRERIDDGVLEQLASLLSDIRPQPFTLAAVRYLPGAVYLTPASDDPFARATQAVAGAWPGLPPYGRGVRSIGRYHLTVGRTLWLPIARKIAAAVQPFLPIDGRTDQALLFAVDADERVELLARFGIGTNLER